MATVIEYYVPDKLRKQGGKWISPKQRGKVIPFPVPEDKSVLRRLGRENSDTSCRGLAADRESWGQRISPLPACS
jgi:hypothetical protein